MVLVTCALVFLFPTLPPCCYRFAEKHIFSFECSCFFFVKQIVFSLKFPDWVEPSFQQVSTTSSGVLLSDQAEVSRPEVRRNWKLTQNISFGRASNRFICYVYSYFDFFTFFPNKPCRSNQLSDLPEGVSSLVSLREITISNNRSDSILSTFFCSR